MNYLQTTIQYVKDNPKCRLSFIVSSLYRLLGRNQIKIVGTGNKLLNKNTYMRRCKVVIHGSGNVIDLGQAANYLTGCNIYIYGNYNVIHLGERNVFLKADLYIEDDGSKITFGSRNRILGFTHVAACEGKSVSFGDGCLFSTDVIFRNTDSHAILDNESGERINPAKPIKIGDRVWFGNKTTILKGVTIEDDCVVATGAIVTRDVPANSIVAGVPAKVVKTGIIWRLQR